MAITTYATVAMFFEWGLPQTALGSRTVADVQSALDAASSDMDDAFRGRFPLPLSAVGLSVSKRCVYLARYAFMGGRGFDPQSDADKEIVSKAKEAETWLDKVQRRVIFPDVTSDPSARVPTTLDPAGAAQPNAISFSVIDVTTGQTACNRGW